MGELINNIPGTNAGEGSGMYDDDVQNGRSEPEGKDDNKPSDEAKEVSEGNEGSENEKIYGDALRRLLGVKSEEPLGDLENRISQFVQSTEDKLAAARNQVIDAELRSLRGYDTKLLNRLIDRSELGVDDSGRVTGLDEAVKKAAAEFPAVVIKPERKPFVPIGSGADEDTKPTMNDLIRGKR